MLESLLNFEELEHRPYLMFFWSLIIGSVATFISFQVAYTMTVSGVVVNLEGIFSVLFAVIPSVYFITLMIVKEEEWEEGEIERHYSKTIWRRHEKDILILLFYFAGLTLSFAFWSSVLPEQSFQIQVSKINQVRGMVEGNIQGYAVNATVSFFSILVNNLQVMIFSFLFSFIFGAGAVFIIVWNASVLGVYIGQLSKALWQIPIVSLAFLPHGIPEIAGYLFAALAGGLISAAIIRKHKAGVMKIVFLDSLKLFMIGVGLIFVGAAIEAFL